MVFLFCVRDSSRVALRSMLPRIARPCSEPASAAGERPSPFYYFRCTLEEEHGSADKLQREYRCTQRFSNFTEIIF